MVIRLLLIGLLLAASTTTALAGGLYVGASGGASFGHQSDGTYAVDFMWDSSKSPVDVTYHTGYAINAAVGYNFDRFRVEAEYGHKDAAIDKITVKNTFAYGSAQPINSDLTVDSYMVNAYYDYPTAYIISPFIGGGIGFANVELNGSRAFDNNFDRSDRGFGYQVMVGLTAKLVKKVDVDLYYRFMGTTFDLTIPSAYSSTTISPYHSSNIMAGLRYTF